MSHSKSTFMPNALKAWQCRTRSCVRFESEQGRFRLGRRSGKRGSVGYSYKSSLEFVQQPFCAQPGPHTSSSFLSRDSTAAAMGASQSRANSEKNTTIDRLKRYSRADLKSPLKAAFGRNKGDSGQENGGGSEGATSDYETPIYETQQRVPVSVLI